MILNYFIAPYKQDKTQIPNLLSHDKVILFLFIAVYLSFTLSAFMTIINSESINFQFYTEGFELLARWRRTTGNYPEFPVVLHFANSSN